MIAYEVLTPLEISYRIDGNYSNMNNFHLDTGDFFFLEPGYWGRVEIKNLWRNDDISSDYVETSILKKIVFMSTKLKRDDAGEIDFYKVWEEEDNINLFNPVINKSLTIKEALEVKLVVESVAWKRAAKLKELGI
jgi:hypothetical protein